MERLPKISAGADSPVEPPWDVIGLTCNVIQGSVGDMFRE